MNQHPSTERDTPYLVKAARKHFAAARTIDRNLALKRYNGRNGDSTLHAYREHMNAAWACLDCLPRSLQGLLTAEHQDAHRLSASRDAGMKRPELTARLKDARDAIQKALAVREES